MTERRIVSIWLPALPIEVWLKRQARRNAPWPDDLPLGLMLDGAHGQILQAVNPAAKAAGVTTGARVTDMRALCPELHLARGNLARDTAALTRLVHAARRWSPWSTPDGADGLFLDTTGADHLLGGEAAMLADIQSRLERSGLTAQLAIAPNPGAAWALARFGTARQVSHDLADLAPLPVAALRLEEDTLLLLRRLGLNRIGDLSGIPRLSLMRRFARATLSDNPLLRLDQAMGRLAEPLSAPDAPPEFEALARLAEPVMDPSDWLPGLIETLCAQLAARQMGCRHLRLSVFRTDGERRDIRVATAAPSREASHLLRLFTGRLDGIDPGYGFDLIVLSAHAVEPLAEAQPGLENSPDTALHLARLIDRLSGRFGADAVFRPTPEESHIPERAESRASAFEKSPSLAVPAALCLHPARPLRLISPPEEITALYAIPEGPPMQFLWRRQRLRVARFAGPERIAPEWWKAAPATRLRDYFQVEDPQGLRLWIYREGLAHDGRGGPPSWFLQGVFG